MRFIITLLILFSSAYAKIYDCFLFLNEWDILELRLEVLYDHVDEFVIVEAAEGFRGYPKPFNFEEKRARYARFADKIQYVKLEEHIETEDPWVREYWQRNQIMRGLTNCAPEDLILISDVDEFFDGELMADLYATTAHVPIMGFMQRMYRWYLNRTTNEWWSGTAALRYKELVVRSPQHIRDLVRGSKIPLWWTGWHFTATGGYSTAVEKYRQYSHGSDDEFALAIWQRQVQAHPLVPIDSTFPRFVQKNIPYLISIGLIDPSYN